MKTKWILALGLSASFGCGTTTGANSNASELRQGASAGGETDDIECEDGVDAKTGLPCKDDDDAKDHDNVECEDGVDANTGLPCKDDDDGEEDDD